MKEKSVLRYIIFLQIFYLFGIIKAQENPCEPDAPCINGQCIKREYLCDGKNDCIDESDEKYCEPRLTGIWGLRSLECEYNYFKCDDNLCIPEALTCDLIPDCENAADELNCEIASSTPDDNTNFIPSMNSNSLGENSDESTETIDKSTTNDKSTTENAGIMPALVLTSSPRSAFPTESIPTAKSATQLSFDRIPAMSPPHIDHYKIRMEESSPRYYPYSNQPPNQHLNLQYQSTSRSTEYLPIPLPSASHHHPQSELPRFSPRTTSNDESYRNQFSVREYQTTGSEIKCKKLPVFQFSNYTFNYYVDALQRVEIWLDETKGGWGVHASKAIVTSFLINDKFDTSAEYPLMAKNLQVDLGIQLLRPWKKQLNSNKLAAYINILLATCQNPRNFFGTNLIEMLKDKMRNDGSEMPSIFPYISLCLANASISEKEIDFLKAVMISDDVESKIELDRKYLATIAMACFQRQQKYQYMRNSLLQAFRQISNFQHSDGSFGSIYSTALAAQALLSVETSERWDFIKTADYLLNQQDADGSFGDMLATYLIAPVLKGKNLLHIRNANCCKTENEDDPDDNEYGPKKVITYTLKFDYPRRTVFTETLRVPVNASFFDVMEHAAKRSPNYKFEYNEIGNEVFVNSIRNIPNDPERGYYWFLYLQTHEDPYILGIPYSGNIKELLVKHYEEFTFWYHYSFEAHL